jgi:Rrf2 family protein
VDLATRYGRGPQPLGEIAERQEIPTRFLEVIFSQLRQGGFVESRRGSRGGYQLAKTPEALTVGEVVRFIQGPVGPVACADGQSPGCGTSADCALRPMWKRVHDAVSDIYDGTNLADLASEQRRLSNFVPNYAI